MISRMNAWKRHIWNYGHSSGEMKQCTLPPQKANTEKVLYWSIDVKYSKFKETHYSITDSVTKGKSVKVIVTCKYSLTQSAFTCSKLTIKTLEQGVKYIHHWRRTGVFIVNFEHVLADWEIFITSDTSWFLDTDTPFHIRIQFIRITKLKFEEISECINPFSAKSAKWPNTLKQFVGGYRRIVWVC